MEGRSDLFNLPRASNHCLLPGHGYDGEGSEPCRLGGEFRGRGHS
jgi:hypothetical protein